MTLYIYKEIFIDGCYDEPPLNSTCPTIIDVGANTGLFAIRMKQLYPQASLPCYEPMPANFKQLRENLDKSKFSNCVAYQEGVGGSTRNEKLYIHEKNLGGHSIYAGIAGSQSVDIALVDLKTALDRLKGVPCDLLKLDCEGAEYEIIKSIDQNSAKQIKRLVFEPTSAAYDVQELIESLTRLGYQVAWNEGLCIAIREGIV